MNRATLAAVLCALAGAVSWRVLEVPAGSGWQALGSGRFTYAGDLSAVGIQRVKNSSPQRHGGTEASCHGPKSPCLSVSVVNRIWK